MRASNKVRTYLTYTVQECGGQLRNRMDIFCSTSVRSRAWQNSSKQIIWSLFVSASRIVRSAMLVSCSSLEKIIQLRLINRNLILMHIITHGENQMYSRSYLILAPTIMWRMASSSSLEILPSLSKSYIEKATVNKENKN